MRHSKAIDIIPAEILSIIFEECLPSTVGSRINRRWRDVSFGCSKLWVEIRVRIPETDRVAESPSSCSSMVHLLEKKPLQRLSIGYTSALGTDSLESGTHPTWVSEVLKPTLTEVQLTTLRLDGVHIAELANLAKGAFKFLRSLSVSMTTQSLEKKGRRLLPRKIQVLKDMPHLSTLILNRQALAYIGKNHGKVPLPWSQLTCLEDLGLSWPMAVANFSSYISFLQRCLSRCSNLVDLTLWADEMDTDSHLSEIQGLNTTTITTLNNLESLTLSHGPLRYDPVKSTTLFHFFRFPNLKKLSIVAARSQVHISGVRMDMNRHLRRFTKLEHLHLDIAHFGRDAAAHFLSSIPSVKTLSIRREFPLPGARYDEGCLITAIDQHPALLPQLETLIFNCDQTVSARLAACHEDSVLQLVRTILQGEEDARFYSGLTQDERRKWEQAIMGFRPHPTGWLKRIVLLSSDGKRADEIAKNILGVSGVGGRFEVVGCCEGELPDHDL
ncbi:hypothetical protein FA13DRAFT_1794727 [Coprinellus micaceus]|uniref:F-box domain-containing protein n=1 Tax=Coprinellus micaceus TaxID=71717 RepID=A0A4Y7T226_COPMI|nr:hypothetical protein FA13DRAFT_1794727 [Coprinellus micaceus]